MGYKTSIIVFNLENICLDIENNHYIQKSLKMKSLLKSILELVLDLLDNCLFLICIIKAN